jgi:hypothetical protein
MRSAVGNSPHFSNESPFQTFTPKFQPEFLVHRLDELSETEIRSENGVSCRPLYAMHWSDGCLSPGASATRPFFERVADGCFSHTLVTP